MEQLNFNNIYDFCDYAVDIHDRICDCKDIYNNNITFVAKYAEAREIINYMICEGYFLRFADFSEPEDDSHGYRDEFYVMICDDELFVEPAKKNGKYMDCEDAIVFIVDGCSSAIIPHIKGKLVYDVAFDVDVDEDEYDDCECDCCHECDCDMRKRNLGYDDQVDEQDNAQVTKNDNKEVSKEGEKKTETYRVNGKEVSKDEYEGARKEVLKRFEDFDEIYTDMIRNSLLFQLSYRDLYNDMLKDFCGF